MDIERLLANSADDILRVAASHRATDVRVFGAILPKWADANYLGVLVDMKAGSDLLDLAAIEQDLEDMLDCHVHIVTEAMLDCHVHIVTEAMLNGFRGQVLREAVSVRGCAKGQGRWVCARGYDAFSVRSDLGGGVSGGIMPSVRLGGYVFILEGPGNLYFRILL